MFGLVTKKQHDLAVNNLRLELESYKAELAKAVPGWLLKTGEAEHWNMPDPSVYGNQADLYRTVSWVLSACDRTGDACAPIKFNVKRRVGEDERDIPNHPFELLLDRPNPLDSRSELIKYTVIMWMLNGNSYWWLNKPDQFSPPTEIWPIPPRQIIPNPDGRLYLKNYLYYPGNGEELTFETHEIVHFKRTNPFSRFVGLSAVESIAIIAYGDIGMASWNAKLFQENNGRLPGLITFEQYVGDDVWDSIKTDMDEAARKRAFLMLRGVGQGGVNWIQNAVTQREMEFLAGRKANRDEIWDVLAPGLVSYLSELSGKASSRTGESAFERLSVFPKLDDMAQKITNEILPLYGGRKLVGRFEDVRSVDQTLELEKQRQYENTHTVGEIRVKWYSDDKFGDERDDMSVDEFRSKSSEVKNPPPPPKPNPFLQPAQKPVELIRDEENQNLSQELANEVAGKSQIILELDRFQRKALKSLGKDVPFESEFIPVKIMKSLHSQLPGCFTDKDVKQIFAKAKKDAGKMPEKKDYMMLLAESMNRMAEALMVGNDVQTD